MKIVGVTACPTGIAHTYMAAEKLQSAAEAGGHLAKFETQGAKTENILTKEEISNADIIILGVDKQIDMDRFAGKTVKKVSTSRAIKESDKVIEEAIAGNGTFVVQTSNEKSNGDQTENKGLYNHFMNGVNYMLPFVIAGGILIAMSFAFGIEASDPTSDSYNVIAAALSQIGGDTAFALMVPALAAGISVSIAGKSGFAPGIVAGMLASSGTSGFLGGMLGGLLAGYATDLVANKVRVKKSVAAIYQLIIVPLAAITVVGFAMIFIVETPVAWLLNSLTEFLNGLGETSGLVFGLLIGIMMAADMGGPINKSISTFSIGLMSAGVNAPIAACMMAGMTPPLGIALAALVFKNKFTEEERTSGKSCWILGASYITEGAIPFAVADPIRVIPSLMAGSAVAGAISMSAGVQSMAPHGGIWVMLIPNVITNLPMYILAMVAGTLVTCFTLGFLKKPAEERLNTVKN
ncbi:PTS system, fructose-specific IIBC component (EIIBC-Fru) (Fructose-permease IIBC component) (Phosphotransferase enzyme II, BC component) [Marinilactibacillus psychrotolerans 42ea]|uniref:PTS system, fructose-specific IIBC component (EIIBC-Fru) (Fructose-permease IIBC component) (Phosphotransferase enzyme II, BC component) n=1 Tax=Marinilactibacillus psychrotolerans 42ea TaxID=1255609 RepID=A0A1R4IUD2_9LACT|nr:fructose-specific PTS transporter subunit EIIC [Marinilactibacillus psychrotolerans]SJN23195.1 PTS system, fructose-specific IIBC component (EIIBC-Fru) (Fructose-permease IIBC component) (Phosphotransferase enzyme II, BC component) [Marinilactibacillus psychrotolerans 42ea]